MLRIIRQTFTAWWRELIPFAMLNALWLGLQMLVITAAPATAAFYVVAGNVAAGDPGCWDEFWAGFRRHFWKANRWGLMQIPIYFIGAFNFFYYAESGSILWGLIKITWGGTMLLWTVLQLLYWPLILEAEDQSIRNTLHNALVMLWLHPFHVLGLALVTVIIVAVSVLLAAPVGLVMMALVTLLGTFTVRDRLRAFQG